MEVILNEIQKLLSNSCQITFTQMNQIINAEKRKEERNSQGKSAGYY